MSEATGNPRDPYDINYPKYKRWQDYIDAYIAKAPPGMK
jgi:hypothetical protein